MKKSLLLLTVMLFSLPTFADTFACLIEVKDQRTWEYEEEYRSRKVQVELLGWMCDGKISNDLMEVKLHEPQLGRDGEVFIKTGPVHRELKLKINDEISCSCSLM